MLFVWPIVWPLQVFLRAGGMAQLDKLRTEHMAGAATTVQRHVRGYLQRLRYVALRSAALLLQRSVRAVLARRAAALGARGAGATCGAATAGGEGGAGYPGW